MAHPVCEDSETRTFAYFRQLWQLLLDPGTDRETKLEAVFDEETADFDLPYAFLSRIDRSTDTQYIEISHGDHPLLQPGESVPLSQSYCRETVADPDGIVRISDALAEGWADDPAYETFELGSYVGSIVEADDVYGTLCFGSSEPRADPITERETALVEMLARWVGYEIQCRTDVPRESSNARRESADVHGGRTHDPGTGTGERLESTIALPSEEVDTLMDVLSKRSRRLLLSNLLGGAEERGIDEILDETGDDALRTEFQHNHLPKLDQAGYVEWDRNRDVIERGPRFGAVEPLLELIDRSVIE